MSRRKALPAPAPIPEEEKNFEIEVSDFIYVKKGIKAGRALRFTFTWKFEHPQYGLIGASQEGWLMTRDPKTGKLRVSPPITRFGPAAMAQKQLSIITVGLHDLILGIIVNNKTKKGKSYADFVGTSPMPTWTTESPAEFDEELPKEIQNGTTNPS